MDIHPGTPVLRRGTRHHRHRCGHVHGHQLRHLAGLSGLPPPDLRPGVGHVDGQDHGEVAGTAGATATLNHGE